MRLTDDNKRAITERIRAGAAAVFRARGYSDVTLDDIMQEAGLTRGAFYAHFKSKAALLEAVLRHEHPLLRMLRERPGPDAAALHTQLIEILTAYVDPQNVEAVFNGCSLAALTGEATRATEEIKSAYGAAFDEILLEMARGQDRAPERYATVLVLASGAVRTAQAMASDDQRRTLLTAVKQTIVEHLERIRSET